MGNDYRRCYIMLKDMKRNTVGFVKIQTRNGGNKLNICVQNMKHTKCKELKILVGSSLTKQICHLGRLLLDSCGRGEICLETDLQDLDSIAFFDEEEKIAEGYCGDCKPNFDSFFSKGEEESDIEILEIPESISAIMGEIVEDIVMDDMEEDYFEFPISQDIPTVGEVLAEETSAEAIEELWEENEKSHEEITDILNKEAESEREEESVQEESVQEEKEMDLPIEVSIVVEKLLEYKEPVAKEPECVICCKADYCRIEKILRALRRRRDVYINMCDWFIIEDKFSYINKVQLLREPFLSDGRIAEMIHECMVGIMYNQTGDSICGISYAVPLDLWDYQESEMEAMGFEKALGGYMVKTIKIKQ